MVAGGAPFVFDVELRRRHAAMHQPEKSRYVRYRTDARHRDGSVSRSAVRGASRDPDFPAPVPRSQGCSSAALPTPKPSPGRAFISAGFRSIQRLTPPGLARDK